MAFRVASVVASTTGGVFRVAYVSAQSSTGGAGWFRVAAVEAHAGSTTLTWNGTDWVVGGTDTASFTFNGTSSMVVSGSATHPLPITLRTPTWTWVLVDAPHITGGGAKGSLTTARNRVLSLAKNDQSTCTWQMDFYQPGTSRLSQEVLLVTPRSTDVIVYRDDKVMFRGRVATHEVDAADTGQVSVLVSAMSYKGMLKRRFLLDADCVYVKTTDTTTKGPLQRNYGASVDVGSIVWDLVRLAQKPTFGTLGITASVDGINGGAPITMTVANQLTPSQGTVNPTWVAGNGNVGFTAGAVTEFPVGISVYDAIEQLAAGNASTLDFGAGAVVTTGFDWDVIPDATGALQLHMWSVARAAPHSPGRGEITGFILDYGGTVSTSAAGYDVADYANLVRVSGGDTVVARTVGGGNAVDGLWEGVDTLQGTQPLIDKAAAASYYVRSQVRQAYTLTLRPEAWRFGDTDLGDTVQVQVPNLEGIDSDAQQILTQSFTLGDDGQETVAVTVGALPLFTVAAAATRQRGVAQSVAALKRTLYGGSA